MAALVAGGLGLAGCTPPMPAQPEDGYLLVPRVAAGRLGDAAGFPAETAGGLTPSQRAQLRRLLGTAHAVAARQVAVEVSGALDAAQRGAVTAEIRASLPQSTVTFSPGGEGSPVVRLRYLEVVPKRCVNSDHWRQEDGLLPSGCALALTFGRMVSDPGDLVEGKVMGPALLEPLARDALRYSDGGSDGGRDGTAKPMQTGDTTLTGSSGGSAH